MTPRLNAKELRKSAPEAEEIRSLKRNPIYFVVDNVYDTYNIGSLFRLADAAGIEKVYLCGSMEYPPSSRIHKASVGTENWVPWEKVDSTLDTVKKLKSLGVQVIAVEQDPSSLNYKDLGQKLKFPCAIVVGHETEGVSPEVLKECDLIVEFPMYGINKSFNVWGSAAVITYKILEFLGE